MAFKMANGLTADFLRSIPASVKIFLDDSQLITLIRNDKTSVQIHHSIRSTKTTIESNNANFNKLCGIPGLYYKVENDLAKPPGFQDFQHLLGS
jgi:hypothetical protein